MTGQSEPARWGALRQIGFTVLVFMIVGPLIAAAFMTLAIRVSGDVAVMSGAFNPLLVVLAMAIMLKTLFDAGPLAFLAAFAAGLVVGLKDRAGGSGWAFATAIGVAMGALAAFVGALWWEAPLVLGAFFAAALLATLASFLATRRIARHA